MENQVEGFGRCREGIPTAPPHADARPRDREIEELMLQVGKDPFARPLTAEQREAMLDIWDAVTIRGIPARKPQHPEQMLRERLERAIERAIATLDALDYAEEDREDQGDDEGATDTDDEDSDPAEEGADDEPSCEDEGAQCEDEGYGYGLDLKPDAERWPRPCDRRREAVHG